MNHVIASHAKSIDSHPKRSVEKGFSLLEVMIALFILAVGALGFAAMQMKTTNTFKESLVKADAHLLATQMVSRMRSNVGDNWAAGLLLYKAAFDNANLTHEGCSASDCSKQTTANNDVVWFKNRLSEIGGSSAFLNDCGGEGESKAKCLVVAWDSTTPTLGSDSTVDCLTSAGRYYLKSTCYRTEDL